MQITQIHAQPEKENRASSSSSSSPFRLTKVDAQDCVPNLTRDEEGCTSWRLLPATWYLAEMLRERDQNGRRGRSKAADCGADLHHLLPLRGIACSPIQRPSLHLARFRPHCVSVQLKLRHNRQSAQSRLSGQIGALSLSRALTMLAPFQARWPAGVKWKRWPVLAAL